MSLYNQIFKTDPLASFLLGALGVNPLKIARFRDCYLNEDGTRVVILTRTGGGNREEYESANKSLAQCPGYVGDEDADSDNTYAYFYFEPAKEFKEGLKIMAPEYGRCPAIERFFELIKKLGDPAHENDSEVVRAMEVGRRVMGQVKDSIDSPGIKRIEV